MMEEVRTENQRDKRKMQVVNIEREEPRKAKAMPKNN